MIETRTAAVSGIIRNTYQFGLGYPFIHHHDQEYPRMGIEVNGKTLEVDEEGYLANLAEWEPEVANVMAKDDGTELTDEHWEIINFLREYYEEYQIAPAIRVLTKAIGKKLGKDKGNSKYLYELFPYGPAKQACRYGGLPKPTGCV